MSHEPRAPHPLTGVESEIVCQITSAAEQLWDLAATILSTRKVSADDWEDARRIASTLMAVLQGVD